MLPPFSYADAFSLELDQEPEEAAIHSGDLVRTGPNLYPHFTVVAVAGEKAWLRDVQTGADSVAKLDRCRLIRPAA